MPLLYYCSAAKPWANRSWGPEIPGQELKRRAEQVQRWGGVVSLLLGSLSTIIWFRPAYVFFGCCCCCCFPDINVKPSITNLNRCLIGHFIRVSLPATARVLMGLETTQWSRVYILNWCGCRHYKGQTVELIVTNKVRDWTGKTYGIQCSIMWYLGSSRSSYLQVSIKLYIQTWKKCFYLLLIYIQPM